MFESVIAADLGSQTARLATRTKLTEDETRLALDPGNTSRILAVGGAARRLIGTAEAYPVRGGVAEITLAAILLRRLALNMTGRRSLLGVSILLAQAEPASELERAALKEAAREAGFKRIRLFDSLFMGALGAGLETDAERASMLVDVGRERLGAAVFANGGVVARSVTRAGSVTVDRALMRHFAREEGMLIGSQEAEAVKRGFGSNVLRIPGRDPSSGLPVKREIRPSRLREAAAPALAAMARAITETIESAPPEAAADLLDSGVTLIGGGAKQYGLPEFLSSALGVPVRLAPNPGQAVILGLQSVLRSGRSRQIAEAANR